MRILEVSRYKSNFADHQLPFVTEQGEAIARELRNRVNSEELIVKSGEPSAVEYFLVKGNYIKAVGALKAKIREFQPDIVHAHFRLSAITAELQSLVPVVTTFHNGETLNWHVNLMSSLMSLRAKHVIYVAQHIRDLLYFKAKHYSIIPCGVPMEQMVITPKEDARKQLGWSPNKKYILFGGAFENKRKNYALLKDAVAKLSPFYSDEENKNNKNQTINPKNNLLDNQKNYNENTESLTDTEGISTMLTPQSTHKQASGLLDDSLRSTDIDAQYPLNDSEKNTKNSFSDADSLKWEKVEGGERYGDVLS